MLHALRQLSRVHAGKSAAVAGRTVDPGLRIDDKVSGPVQLSQLQVERAPLRREPVGLVTQLLHVERCDLADLGQTVAPHPLAGVLSRLLQKPSARTQLFPSGEYLGYRRTVGHARRRVGGVHRDDEPPDPSQDAIGLLQEVARVLGGDLTVLNASVLGNAPLEVGRALWNCAWMCDETSRSGSEMSGALAARPCPMADGGGAEAPSLADEADVRETG